MGHPRTQDDLRSPPTGRRPRDFGVERHDVGAWGPAAKRFFNTCVKLAGDDRDIDLYHWSSERFSSAWVNTISVLLAKGRARVSVADAATDWPKRIRDMQYLDHESIAAGA